MIMLPSDVDTKRFSELLSKYSGIDSEDINSYAKENSIAKIYENPLVVKATKIQTEKIGEIKEIMRLYQLIKDNEYGYNLGNIEKSGKFFDTYFKGVEEEQLAVAFLNVNYKVKGLKNMGKLAEINLRDLPKEITREAILNNAATVIIARNQLSEGTYHNENDMINAHKSIQALNSVGISMTDSIVRTPEGHSSLINELYGKKVDESYFMIEQPDYNEVRFNISNLYDKNTFGKGVTAKGSKDGVWDIIGKGKERKIPKFNYKAEATNGPRNTRVPYAEMKDKFGPNHYINMEQGEYENFNATNLGIKHSMLLGKGSFYVVVKENDFKATLNSIGRSFEETLGNIAYEKLKDKDKLDFEFINSKSGEKLINDLNKARVSFSAFRLGDQIRVAFNRRDSCVVNEVLKGVIRKDPER